MASNCPRISHCPFVGPCGDLVSKPSSCFSDKWCPFVTCIPSLQSPGRIPGQGCVRHRLPKPKAGFSLGQVESGPGRGWGWVLWASVLAWAGSSFTIRRKQGHGAGLGSALVLLLPVPLARQAGTVILSSYQESHVQVPNTGYRPAHTAHWACAVI